MGKLSDEDYHWFWRALLNWRGSGSVYIRYQIRDINSFHVEYVCTVT